MQKYCTEYYVVKRKAWLSWERYQASNRSRKVAKPRFDSRCSSVSLGRHLCCSHLGAKQSTCCAGLAWRKTCKQN